MNSYIRMPLEGGASCAGYEHLGCKCKLLLGCWWEAEYYAHAGEDYGSSVRFLGWLVGSNISFAVASNTGEGWQGMNTSLGLLENQGILLPAYCPFLETILHAQAPGFPTFRCE